jgi:hypothetical protein
MTEIASFARIRDLMRLAVLGLIFAISCLCATPGAKQETDAHASRSDAMRISQHAETMRGVDEANVGLLRVEALTAGVEKLLVAENAEEKRRAGGFEKLTAANDLAHRLQVISACVQGLALLLVALLFRKRGV